MIKNIIFDLGDVVYLFKCPEALRKLANSEEEYELLKNATFRSKDWYNYDLGLFTNDEITEIFASKVEDTIQKNIIREFMRTWTNYLINNEKIINIIKKLRIRGYRTYILSNSPFDIPEVIKAQELDKLFDGIVYSCYEHINKPDENLFKILIDRYRLEPKECVFLDDREDNCHTASLLGMNSICYNYSDHEDAIKALKKLEIYI